MTQNHFGPTRLDAALVPLIAQKWGTPVYLHDRAFIEESCDQLLNMPNALRHWSIASGPHSQRM